VGILPTRSVHRLCLYSEKVIICYQCHFKGFARVVVYSVFGVGAEIPHCNGIFLVVVELIIKKEKEKGGKEKEKEGKRREKGNGKGKKEMEKDRLPKTSKLLNRPRYTLYRDYRKHCS
jgi:hypothetical protein